MEQAAIWEFNDVKRSDIFSIKPIGDVHVGNVSAEEHEPKLKSLIKEILDDEFGYTILMGDMAEFINRDDKRFDPSSIASWINLHRLDIAKAESDHVLDLIRPLAIEKKILAVVKGNHEQSIARHTDRDVYGDIVNNVKQWGGFREERRLGVGMCGWVVLKFFRSPGNERKAGSKYVKISLHHGFVGGRLAGAKALNMERWLWNHECDLAFMGHSHDIKVLPGVVETVSTRTGKIERINRTGCITGNWLGQAQYAREAGYFPCSVGYVDATIRPMAVNKAEMIRASTNPV